jgi:small basic protein
MLIMRLLYKPIAVIAGVLAGIAAGAIFKRTWTFLTKETEIPLAMEQNQGWVQVVAAATLKGAVFGGVKALVDRTFATGYFRRTGVWPGKAPSANP